MRSILPLAAALVGVLACAKDPVVTSPPASPQGPGPYGYGTGPYGQYGTYGQGPASVPPPKPAPTPYGAYGGGASQTTGGLTAATPVEVRSYVEWLDRAGGTEDLASVSTGLDKLASALEGLHASKGASQLPGFEADLAQLRGAADRLRQPQGKTPELRHAQVAKDAFRTATDLVDRLAADRASTAGDLSTDLRDMRAAIAAIDGSKPIDDQSSAIRRFFTAARAPLESLGRR